VRAAKDDGIAPRSILQWATFLTDLTYMWPFRQSRGHAGPGLPQVVGRLATEASVVLTDEEREEVEAFYDQIHGMGSEARQPYRIGEHTDAMASSWSAMALQRRAERLAKYIEFGMYRGREGRTNLTDNILSAAIKAYAICPIPIHLYDVACAMDLAGLYDDAEQGFGEFLQSQARFVPDAVQENIASRRDIRPAIAHAMARVAGYRAAA